jgi:putative ABC transport system permease protein
MTGSARQSLTLLLAAAGLVLLMVVVNLANLLLARASARRRELAIRAAIGAGMGRIVRQMLTESLLLAASGGALGILLAHWALAAILVKAPLDLPGLKVVRPDLTVMAFALLATLASGLLFAILPAWRMARTDPQAALKSGSLAITEGRQGGHMRLLLIAAEVALCSLCLVVGGLLLNSFVRLIRVDKGFQTDHAITLNLSLPDSRYPKDKRAAFVRTLLDRIQAVPSVVAAGVSNRGPLTGEGSNTSVHVEGTVGTSVEEPTVDYRGVTPDFFRAMGIPLHGGRLFAPSDRDHRVGVISVTAARRMWPHTDPIGKRFQLGSTGEDWIEVIGVVGDIRTSLQKEPNLTMYLPYWQLARPDIAVVVRTAFAPFAIAGAVRGAIRDLDPELPAPRLRTVDDVVDGQLAERRFQLTLVLIFAGAALLLAVIGVYGVVSQMVARRTNEIGIRMALGASRGDVWLMVAYQGLAPVAAGLAFGLSGALLVARLLSGFLFGVRATDPVTFAAVVFVLVTAAAVACYVPARRATRVDPLVALRYE